MVMIRCPDCGQRVLDVASSCPKCHRVLIQNPLETHDWATLRECGRCGKHIDRDVVLCPYCGHHVRAARLARRTGMGIAAVALAVAGGLGLWRSGALASIADALRSAERSANATPAAPPPPAAPIPIPVAMVEMPAAAAIIAAAPEERAADSVPPPRVTPRPTAAPARAAPGARRSADLVARWTASWAHIRAERTVESEVVQVLPPGYALEVRAMRQGWWEVHVNGALIGYIANSVLTNTPPPEF